MILPDVPFIPAIKTAMQSADQIFNETFLETRAKLLEVAATLDRIDRSSDDGEPLSETAQPQRKLIDEAIQICVSNRSDRAERLQQLFSREYQSNWRNQMQI